MKTFSEAPIHFGIDTVLWNRLIYKPKGHVKNLICLVVKHYIYKQWCANEKLTINGCKAYIRTIQFNEKYYATKNNRLNKHQRKWYPDSTSKPTEGIEQFINDYITDML